jgi:hypothetical protein
MQVEGAELRVLRTMDWSIPIGVLMVEIAHLNSMERDEILLLLNEQGFKRFVPPAQHAQVGTYNWIFLGRAFNSSSIDHASCNFSSSTSTSTIPVWQRAEMNIERERKIDAVKDIRPSLLSTLESNIGAFQEKAGGEGRGDDRGPASTSLRRFVCGTGEEEEEEEESALGEEGRVRAECLADLLNAVQDYSKARQGMDLAVDVGREQKRARLVLIFEHDRQDCLMDTASVLSASQVVCL